MKIAGESLQDAAGERDEGKEIASSSNSALISTAQREGGGFDVLDFLRAKPQEAPHPEVLLLDQH